MFTLSMGTRPDNMEKARQSISEQIGAARADSITLGAVQREINGLVGRLQMRMLSSINRAYYLGEAAREGLPHTFGEDYKELLLALTPEEIQDYCRERLAHFKVPYHIEFTDEELPKSAQGKILKRALKEKYSR